MSIIKWMTDEVKAVSEEESICAEARQRGYAVHNAPTHYDRPGFRIGGTKVTDGSDEWMNAANVRLWQIRRGE